MDAAERHLAFDENSHSAEQLLTRASELMRDALLLLDEASTWKSAALFDHAIAVLPVRDLQLEADNEPITAENWPFKAVRSRH